MLSKIPERIMHRIRWVLVVAWLVLIFSLFYDPISPYLTNPNNRLSPFQDHILSLSCLKVQHECLELEPYAIGARVFWGMVIPSAILIVLLFGHETWRRLCPLYFLSQIPRALGLQPRLNIENNSWLVRNHLYLQFAFFFIGLNCRILFINSTRPLLGSFLLLTILSAIMVVSLYGGRSWCHYVCPFGMVQLVFTGPRGLLDSEAHKAPPLSISQSMCRTLDRQTGQEKSTCMNCKTACMDIDSERAYWSQLKKPGRKLAQYGYLGLVIGYFVYYWLYAGNFFYYFSGVWSHEPNKLETLFNPGFYLFDYLIPIPKIIAVPLTLASFVAASCLIFTRAEKSYKATLRKQSILFTHEQILHRIFSICTFLAFNSFFIYGGRPEILRLPVPLQFLFQAIIVLVSTLWLTRTWNRSEEQYMKESLVDQLRRQLKKLPIDFSQFLEGRTISQLTPDEVYVLSKTLPGATQNDRWQVYQGVLLEAIQSGNIDFPNTLTTLQQMRQILGISDEQHYIVLRELLDERENFHLFYPNQQQTTHIVRTLLRNPESLDETYERTHLRGSNTDYQ
jgi:hypothetical protein